MKLESLSLKNWRSHKATTLTFDRVNVLRGPNASGKSSIAMAIEYLVTGRCEVTTENGGNGEQLVSSGTKQTSVEGVFAGGLNVTRTRSVAGGNLILNAPQGVNLVGREATKWMADHGWAPDLLSVILRSARFLELTPGDQQRILASVVEPQVIEIPEQMKHLASVVGCGIAHRLSSVKEAELFRKVFYDRRTELSQAISAIGKPVAPNPEEEIPDLAETQNKLGTLEREWQRLDDDNHAKLEAYRTAMDVREELQTEYEEALNSQGDDKQFAAWNALIQKRNEYQSVAVKRERLFVDLTRAEIALKEAQNKQGVCQTCGQVVSEKAREYGIQQAGLEVGRLNTEVAALPQPPDKAALKEAEIDREKAMRAVATVTRCKLALETPAPVEPDLSVTTERMRLLIERIERGRAVVERIVQVNRETARYNQAEDQLTDLRAKHEACGKLVEYFGPSGVQAEIVGERMGVLGEKLKTKMALWGFDVTINLDPYSIGVATQAQVPLNPSQLSTSERFRFSVALQVTLAELTGIGLVVIDAADILNAQGRRILSQLVSTSELQQAFILSTADEQGNVPDDLNGVKFFWLDARTQTKGATA